MSNIWKTLSNSKFFASIAGIASIVSLIITVVLKDNVVLWGIVTLEFMILIIVICLASYNYKIIGKLDNINMHIIGQTIELENDDNEDYSSKDYSTIIIHSKLSPDKVNEQPKAMLEVRLPSYLDIRVISEDGIRIEESKSDLYKICVPLNKEITYIKLKSFIVDGSSIDKFMSSSKKIDINLTSDLLDGVKNDYVSIDANC